MNISVHILKHLHVKKYMYAYTDVLVCLLSNIQLFSSSKYVYCAYCLFTSSYNPPFSSDLNWSMNKLFLNKMIHLIQTYFSLSMNVYFLHIYLYVYLFSHESQVYLSLYIRSQRASIVIPYTENTSRVTFFNHELPGTNKICN